MASMWRKAMLYLGLGPDDEYDDFDVTGEHQRPVTPRPAVRRTGAGDVQHDPEPSGAVRTLTPSGVDEGGTRNGNGSAGGHATRSNAEHGADEHAPSRRTAATSGSASERPSRSRGAVVRPLPVGTSKPSVIGPTSFNDAQEVADKFKVNVPVILNLQGVERDLARRIIDFASGLCYGLGGQMERVATQVYLLTPSDVEVSPEERRRLRERGYEA
ncbi:MAG TPA: cell division protein SepF [Acidimicrobiales bacterium]|jgi:cell division inhibitor SepF